MPLTKFRKDTKEVKPWTIYLWQEGDLIRGAAKVLFTDGLNEVFISGRWIEKDDQWTKPNKKKDIYIAKSQTKTDLQNTLNALSWYGRDILTNKGIDEKMFLRKEIQSAVTATGIHIDISKINPVRKFPVKNITHEKAKEWGLT